MKPSLFLLLLLSACQVQRHEWTHFRGSALHRGSAAGARPLDVPSLTWSFDTGGTVESSPTVVDGVLYCGTFADHLFALDAATGDELWRFRVEGLVRASPSVWEGLVFFGADDNRFYALDAATRKKRWSIALGEGGQQSSPAIVDGVCYFGGFDHKVFAADARTGKVHWTFTTEGEILSSPVVVGGLLAI